MKLKVLSVTVKTTLHVPGIGELVGGGKRLDRATKAGKFATMKMTLTEIGLAIEIANKYILVPLSDIANLELERPE